MENNRMGRGTIMLTLIKKKEFWGSILFAIISFIVIGYISDWNNIFVYVHYFNAFTIIIWTAVLYITWIKAWSRGELIFYAVLLILVALPHTICSMLSYGSMVCLGVSVVLAIVLCLAALIMKKREQ